MSTWTRSSFCGSGACLEAMRTGPVILVQDSKRPASSGGPLQAWSLGEWDELLGALLAGVPHPGVEPIGGGVRLGLKFPADRHEPLIFDRLEWGAFCNGVIAGEFDPDRLSSPAPALSGGTPEGGTTGPLPVKPLSVEGKDGHDPRDPGEPYLPGGARSAATGAGTIAVPPAPVAAQPRYVLDKDAILELVKRYGAARIKVDRSYFRDHTEHRAAKEAADDLLDAIRAALTPVPTVEPDPFNAEETAAAAARRFAGELERLMAGLRDRGILPAPDAPVGTVAVDTALMAIDDLLAEDSDSVPVDDANEWAKRIAPLVEHDLEGGPR